MTAGIAGLGLIGGSFVKAYAKEGHRVLATNRSRQVLDFAILSGDVSEELTTVNVSECDVVIVCLYPEAAVSFLEKFGPYIGKKPVVLDACGTKRVVVEGCSKLAAKYGFTYVGGHPMAGTQYSGYKYARANMFSGAPMVLVPGDLSDIELLAHVKEVLAPAGFGKFTVTTAEKHDKMIAFTSQLAHVVSNAYVKSPSSKDHKGISAGSYKDLTRVAWLNPEMWAELFLENSDNLSAELGGLICELEKYKDAIDRGDRETLIDLLAEGKRMKEEADGR
ncbi:MAG: prephenate dehydrogenase [Clostridia bacterium]|nr:prephenate dehydrogenase [Clostridia bacterium]